MGRKFRWVSFQNSSGTPIAYRVALASTNITNNSTNAKTAWEENAGWSNLRPLFGGVTVDLKYSSGYAWYENLGWLKLGSDASRPYLNTSPTNRQGECGGGQVYNQVKAEKQVEVKVEVKEGKSGSGRQALDAEDSIGRKQGVKRLARGNRQDNRKKSCGYYRRLRLDGGKKRLKECNPSAFSFSHSASRCAFLLMPKTV